MDKIELYINDHKWPPTFNFPIFFFLFYETLYLDVARSLWSCRTVVRRVDSQSSALLEKPDGPCGFYK